jgi:predicted nucleic acid-binding protein
MIRRGLIATCSPIDLEVGFSARTPETYAEIAADRVELFIDLVLNEVIGDRAREIQQNLAQRGQHRVAGAMDLLIAATAEHYNAVLLHYDSDFDAIAKVSHLRAEWIVPRGSAD